MALSVVFHPDYTVPLPPGHRFPIGKFGRIKDVLLEDGVISPASLVEPVPASRAWLTLAHDEAYVDAVMALALDRRAVRRLGLPLSAPLVRRGRAAVGGTVLTGRLALDHGLACNTAGGSHHAFADHGAGFCLFNDVAVAIRVLRQDGLIERALVVDLDVHQGDGTAAIFQGEAETFTFSLHCEANYPPASRRRAISTSASRPAPAMGSITRCSRPTCRPSSPAIGRTSCSTMPESIPMGRTSSAGSPSATRGLPGATVT